MVERENPTEKTTEKGGSAVTSADAIVKTTLTLAIDQMRVTENVLKNEETPVFSTTEMDFHPVIH